MKKFFTLFTAALILSYAANAQLVVFADDYAAGVSFVPFGGSTNGLTIDNSQSHTGSASLKIPVTMGYTGGALVSAAPSNLTTYNTISFWAKNDNPSFRLDGVGIGNNAATTVYAVERNGVVLTSTWTKYYIPIPVASKLAAETGLFHFAEGAGEGAYNIWIDDIQYESVNSSVLGTPTAAFATETISKAIGASFNPVGTVSTFPVCAEGAMQTARAYFTWTSSAPSIASIDNLGNGTALAQGSTNITGQLGSVTASGILTVNVTSALQEPTVAAPTPPARNPADVISLFSSAYTNNPVDTWSTGWSSGNHVYTELQVSANDTKKYELFHFAGVEFFGTPVDATNMEFLHLDVWSPNGTSLDVRLVDFSGPAPIESTVTSANETGKWVSLDINLSNFTSLSSRSKLSQMLFIVPVSTTATYYIDNIYFYKSGSAPSEPTTAAPTPTGKPEGTISLFSNVYTNNPVDTWSAPWDAADLADVQIAGDDTKKYTNLAFAGIEFISSQVDATNMDFYHVDIWTPDATTFKVKLVDFGTDGAFSGGDDTESELSYTPALGQWVSYDIPMSDFTGLASRAHLAQMLFIGSNSTLYVDNIYFYNKILPVSFVGFTATRKNNTALLQWSTSSEINNKGFAVERSSDGINWKEIQFVKSIAANSSTTNSYSATDLLPMQGKNLYRIRQVDLDGKSSYTFVRDLSFENSRIFTVYPNPAKTSLNIRLGEIQGATANYMLTNMEGKIVLSGSFAKQLSLTNQALDVSRLAHGTYILMIIDGSNKQTMNLVIN